MAGVTLDAGPLIAVERADRRMERWVAQSLRGYVPLWVPVSVIAEVWRGGPRSHRLARFLTLCRIDELDLAAGRSAGELLAATGTGATLDALLVASAASRGDAVLTADPSDISPLALAAGIRVLAL